ncbi:flagellar protein FliT [uncultured Microbulbifer sp.]|uniref:flagellar protein FliT n=1 Tax=uncultured Microbulbifer sp. TaxID=348147 RepID=UPI002635EFFC|nr:flagellar protein FliT [uncultured Microbulbifer sp.]
MRRNAIVGDNPLTSPARVLAAYTSLLARSSRMLACVREHDWFNLVEEQTCYAIEVDAIASAEAGMAFSESERQRKAELLEQILEQDLEVRKGLRQRQDELQQLIGTSQRKRDLSRTYGSLIPLGTPGQ